MTVREAAALRIAGNTSLDTIARDVNLAHEQVGRCLADGLQYAKQAGELLLGAKASLPHGGWLPWLKAQTTVAPRTAQYYMQVAERWEEIANTPGGAHLPLRQAKGLLATPRNAVETTAAAEIAPRFSGSSSAGKNRHAGRGDVGPDTQFDVDGRGDETSTDLDPDQVVERIVTDAVNLTEGVSRIDFSALDRARIADWLDNLTMAGRNLEAFRRCLLHARRAA